MVDLIERDLSVDRMVVTSTTLAQLGNEWEDLQRRPGWRFVGLGRRNRIARVVSMMRLEEKITDSRTPRCVDLVRFAALLRDYEKEDRMWLDTAMTERLFYELWVNNAWSTSEDLLLDLGLQLGDMHEEPTWLHKSTPWNLSLAVPNIRQLIDLCGSTYFNQLNVTNDSTQYRTIKPTGIDWGTKVSTVPLLTAQEAKKCKLDKAQQGADIAPTKHQQSLTSTTKHGHCKCQNGVCAHGSAVCDCYSGFIGTQCDYTFSQSLPNPMWK